MSRFPARIAAALALVLAITAGYFGFTLVLQDLAYTRVQTELGFWGRDDYHPLPQAVVETERTLQSLLLARPQHPDFLILLARYDAWQAYWSQDLRAREDFSRSALENQYLALESRPAHRHSWSTMVEYASRSRGGESEMQLAQARLEALLPANGSEEPVQKEAR